MATIVSQETLVTKEDCQERQKHMAEKLNEIQISIERLPSQILEKTDEIYLRKAEYAITAKALTDSLLEVRAEISKSKDKGGDRIWQVLTIAVQLIVTIVLGALALG